MTQHILQEDTVEDQRTMHRLAAVIAGFMLATATMALIIAYIAG